MRARYVIRITPADVGGRVSIRARLPDVPDDDPGPAHTDVLGTLESWADGTLAIRRKDGTLTHVAEADLAAGRPVPPAPERRQAGRP